MKYQKTAIVLLLLAACHEVPRGDAGVDMRDEALASYRGLGVVTLPRRFDVASSDDARVETFSARDAELRDTLLTLFKDSDVNLLVEDGVDGVASFDIKTASLEETFEALLESYDLAYRWDGDFLRIEGSTAKVFDVDYPGQAAPSGGAIGPNSSNTSGSATGDAGASGTGFWDRLEADLERVATNASSVVVNRRLGTVAVEGKPRVVRRVATYLEASRRRATRQVSIEARIVEVSLRKEFKAGVDWSILPGVFNTSKSGTLPGGAILGQSATAGVDTFRFGLLKAGDFSVLLDALETQGQVRVLSSPRVATLHNVPAQIRVVEQVPVITREIIDTDSASRTQFSVRFEDAGVTVSVTPQIGEDGIITAHVMPSIVEVSGYISTPDNLVTEPILNTRSVTTVLRVPDGQPIVLGGLRSERKTESLEKVPLLGDIPIVGNLFRTTIQERADTELVIVLTPRILTSAWEREDWQRSLDRIHRIEEPFRPSTIPMNDSAIDIGMSSLGGIADVVEDDDGPRVPIHAEGETVREKPATGDNVVQAKRISRFGLARVAFRRALQALDRGDAQSAIDELNRATTMNPTSADAWLVLGAIQYGRGRFADSRHAYARVLATRPGDMHATIGLGLVAMRRGDSLRAEYLFRESLERSFSPVVLNNLGVALLAQGRLDEARRQFESALTVTSNLTAPLAEAALNLAVCQDRIGNVREAAEAYRAYMRSGGRLDEPGVEVIADRVRSVLAQPIPVSAPSGLDAAALPAGPQFDH
ncbi:MAG: tetratricopeptide repeat protein [Planctomycetes bacterium]|nr:tetratricopeptide repeat protein [Planctomycetota bacterium]